MTTDPRAAQIEADAPTVETLHENRWLSLRVIRKPDRGVNGYVYSHESRCAGRIVALLPFADFPDGRRYLVKSEMTPCWGLDQILSAITGGYEGDDIADDAVREMLEETGYTITRADLIPLGESYASKSADTVYTLFTVDLTGRRAGEAIGDGTRVEAESAALWLTADDLADVRDPQVALMFLRLAAQLVDAVHAAGRDDQGEVERERHRAQDVVMVEALTRIRRLVGGLPEGVQRAITIAASRIEDLAHEHGQADGWAQAVAALRDHARYSAHTRVNGDEPWSPGGCRHFADYLEAVGPDEAPKLAEEKDRTDG